MAALADAGDVEPSAVGLRLQDQLGGGLIILGAAGLQKGVELLVHSGEELRNSLLALLFQHNDTLPCQLIWSEFLF